ncbi:MULTISPECIES: monovalent cation/H+ antiporter complex subunit F [Prauserella salsuginis group]|uniref:Multicomponent Na+:H+ antiporter subunit F n=2 Tax=Prauserella salsuginis group TaxID=2893672 RepID=A0A839XV98_9PSEU|nr:MULTISPECIES: monovalent cation/H+ antiporter complex subunit F [Prauserella salsuginis group]MBB3665314.1 multicomponent Na+:H+ antiporter subunit F [Prauserella sediminis]MCR3723051.1 multisubunit sodium/proton antiporter, MrpF subunit (TC 2.A.63.1) [Prauserella flava]MCR3732574.1 multisubunit sodium/proton antiporter, MrpF subunit (TC 2.A.63.1) [Prauserella salsuginis]
MSIVFAITFGLLAVAGLLTLLRIVRGPRTLDRILAVDVLVVLIVAGTAVGMAMSSRGIYIALIVVVALLGFVGTISVVRLVERREEYR